MKDKMTISLVGVLTAAGLLAAGCGGGGSTSTSTAGSTPTPKAQAAVTGNIPDNQVFLLFHDPEAGYSIRYPEGWARTGSGNNVTFQQKANVVHVTVSKGAPLRKRGVRALYLQTSVPDPATGKRLQLVTERYEYGDSGKVAVLDLATPIGVDNVDAYRTISDSFEWRR